ncbi:hypothetical protein [Arthrobacter sp. Soil736]|uniref:hypothetical protein n=1 Tax=Arthrobacter sp. Soil736 TaxID=1736395 RepID=UPI0012FA8C9D|nr:hypothetical protein [Arthrobacter sp. Soil736]
MTPVLNSRVVGSDLEVETTHFSNWFTQSWDWLASWAKDQVTAMFTATHGEDPKCENEDAARAGGITVTGGPGDAVKWCMGKAATGATVIKLNNSRGYAVSAESTPGLSIGTRGDDVGQWLPRLAKYITFPSSAHNDVEILGPGETAYYNVDSTTGSSMGVKIMPSPPAYQATVLHFAAETAIMMYSRFHKGADPLTISAAIDAMDAVDCASAVQGMTASPDISTPAAAASYVNAALQAVWPCLGRTMEHLVAAGTSEAFAVLAGGVVSWLESGLEKVVDGIRAIADTVLHPDGYQIIVTVPDGLQAYHGILGTGVTMLAKNSPYQAQVDFRYPAGWAVSSTPLPPLMSDTHNGVGVVSSAGLHEFQLVFYADLNEPCGAIPARLVESTPVQVESETDSRQGQQWIQSTVFHPPAGYGYSFPVVLTLQLSDSPGTVASDGQDCPGRSSFKAGPVFGRFLHQRGFNAVSSTSEDSTPSRRLSPT